MRNRNDPQQDSSFPSIQNAEFDRFRIRRAARPSSGCRNAIVQPAKKPIGAVSGISISAGIHAVRFFCSALYGFFTSPIAAAVFSTAASRKPISLPAPLIDSHRAVVDIPDSQTTEQAPQVVHLKRLLKRGARSGPDDVAPESRAISPGELVSALLQSAMRSIAPSGKPALTDGHAVTHSWQRLQASSSSIWRGENQRDWISLNISFFRPATSCSFENHIFAGRAYSLLKNLHLKRISSYFCKMNPPGRWRYA